jgi:hypothetical protein
MFIPSPAEEELESLRPFCPCRVCNQTWFQAFLGFFTHGNCATCNGCLKSELYSKEHLVAARAAKAAAAQ